MPANKKHAEAVVPAECKRCKNREEIEARLKVSTGLREVIAAFEQKLGDKTVNVSMGDYLKLVQLEQEAEREAAKEIKVTWVDPTVTSESER